MMENAFSRYAPFIQEYIYKKGWMDLRQVQVEACEAILDTDSHVIVASGTASGKTEAAFFPILTKLWEEPSKSVGVIYIGPLKALINDQFSRLDALLEETHIPVWAWHGDITQTKKQQAAANPSGILQITPEALEAMVMKHPELIKKMFWDLKYVVIDEIHALMGEDRGLQVLCLLKRIEEAAECSPRRIGLSATLSEYEPAMEYLSAGTKRDAVAVGISNQKRTISLYLDSVILPCEDKAAQKRKKEYEEFLYDYSHVRKCLLFTNSRGKAEEIILKMKEIAGEKEEPDVFCVHHGSVAAELRGTVEKELREGEGPLVTAATLTLELGIDIGDLDSTVQLGAPFSCSSFVQRLGRSGRRTGKSQMMFLNLYEEGQGEYFDKMPWDLLRSIAVIQLYLEERWVEPFCWKKKPYSLLAHQTLSTLMSVGELAPAELAKKVLTLPAFKGRITKEEFRELLLFMIEQDFLERMESGGIIPGLKGERIAGFYTFYGVFKEEESFIVKNQKEEVGTLTICPVEGDVFVLGGASWKAVHIEREKHVIQVEPAKEAGIPSFTGGSGEIHEKIVKRMKQVLMEDEEYPYLKEEARKLLSMARSYARGAGMLTEDLLKTGQKTMLLCPWTGTKNLRTIEKLLTCGLKEELNIKKVFNGGYYLQITTALSKEELIKGLRKEKEAFENPDLFVEQNKEPFADKYDFMVPPSLLKKAYFYNQMDLEEAFRLIGTLK